MDHHNIHIELGGFPTVIWSGNGYHIHQPLDMPALHEIVEFTRFDEPSVKFLRYVERRLTDGMSDPNHNVSFRSCMFRIPGSLNSKCIASGKDPVVRTLQKWDGWR